MYQRLLLADDCSTEERSCKVGFLSITSLEKNNTKQWDCGKRVASFTIKDAFDKGKPASRPRGSGASPNVFKELL
jgi:hypothetical protein